MALVLILAACGDTLVDHRNVAIQDTGDGASCDENQVLCEGVCRSQVVAEQNYVCGTSCLPCGGALPANAARTCTPVGVGGHDGVCGFECAAGFLKTETACVAPALVAAGGQFSCATTTGTGEVHCWGANDKGQLGPGVAAASRATSARVQSAALVNVTALAAGPAHACAVVGGTVYCWGDGTGFGVAQSSATPVAVAGLGGSTVLAAGANHTCGIAGGALECVGDGTAGGGTPALGGTVLEISAGDSFTCALVDDGTVSRAVKCWGANDFGQRGTGSATGPDATPASVPFPAGAPTGLVLRHVTAGARHACATTNEDGQLELSVFCWGDNAAHQIGVNASGTIAAPTSMKINKPVSLTAATPTDGGGVATCVVVEDNNANALQCWSGDVLAAGGGTGVGEKVDLTTLSPPGRLSVGGDHACIVDPTGRLACWGHGTLGQLGNAATENSAAPVLVVDR